MRIVYNKMISVSCHFFISFGYCVKKLLYLLNILKKRRFDDFSFYLFNLINAMLICDLKIN